ncbi:MAG: M56 family metallopeptidase [Ferruginibacter sp.]
MEQFNYSFAVTAMHSIWQTGVLFLVYSTLFTVQKRTHPGFKRNSLFVILTLQLCLSVITFLIYYFNPQDSFQNKISALLYNNLFTEIWLERYAGYLFYLYFLVVTFKVASLLFNCSNFIKNYNQHLIKPTAEIKMFTILSAHHFGIQRKVSIWFSNNVSSPLTFGFFKPVILMPLALLNGLSVLETEALIIHEINHIKNNDYILNWLLVIIETIYFFNPFVKIIANRIKLEREKSCDTRVIQFHYAIPVYAEALLKVAKLIPNTKKFQLAAVFNNSQLFQRIHFFSQQRNQEFNKTNKAIFSGVVFTGVFFINLFILLNLKNISPSITAGSKLSSVVAVLQKEKTDKFTIYPKGDLTSTKPVSKNNKRFRAKTNLPETVVASSPVVVNYPDENIIALPAALTIEAPEISKEVVVNEENSSGKMVTKAYKVQLKNGQWVAQPLWTLTEIKSPKDSLRQKGDTLYHLISPIQ